MTIACPDCTFANPSTANFCQNCGRRLQAGAQATEAVALEGAMRGERRVVTVLFCDVAGSTSLAEGLDPETWVEIMNGAFPHLIAPVYQYGGIVSRLLGDAILAFFGAPTAHEDDPQRAVLAALQILERVAVYRSQVQAQHGLDFQVRVGINTGLIFVGEVGSGLRQEYTAMGDAVNVAARMEQTAAPGTIQIAEDTYRHVAPYVEVEPLGGVAVKGKQAPVSTYRVLRARSDAAQDRSAAGLRSPLVGREQEMELLQRAVADLRLGRGGIVCVMAEAGLGKTRLIQELQAGAAPGILWAHCRGLSYERMRPYGLFQQLLRAVCQIPPQATPETVRQRLSAALGQEHDARGARLLARLLGVEDANGEQALSQGQELRRELQEAMTHFWRLLAQRQPLLLVFDDLHWADDSSLDVLQRLLQLSDEEPILFLCAFRPHRQAPVWQLWQAAERDFAHRTHEITLKSLSLHESRRLVDGLLQAPALPPDLEKLVLEKAEGNPFFVEETVRELIDRGVLVRDTSGGSWCVAQQVTSIAIPDTLQALLTARIDRLPEEPRRTLQLAAVIGRDFSARVLTRVLQAISPGGADHVDRHLIALLRAGLILEQARLPSAQYSFRHGLTQDAAYASILLRDRRAYHRLVGQALEDLHAGNLEEHAAMLGYHYAEAGEAARAGGFYERAGDRAVAVYANAEALTYYTRALELRRAADGRDLHALRDLQRKRGRVNETLGRFDEALADFEASLALARAENDLRDELQDLLELGFLWAARDYERAGRFFHEALARARRLEEPGILAQSLNRVGNWYVNAGQPLRAQDVHREALAILEALGDEGGLAETYDLLGLALGNGGQLLQSMAHYERAIDLFRKLGKRRALASALATRASICALYQTSDLFPGVREFPQAAQGSAEALAVARDIGWRAGESYAHFSQGVVQAAAGDYVEAERAVQAGLALATQIGHRQWICAGNWGMGCIFLDLCQFDLARRHLEESLALAQTMGSTLWSELVAGMLGRALAAAGELQRASELMQLCYRPQETPRSAWQRMVWRAAAELALARGDGEGVLAIVQPLLDQVAREEGFELRKVFSLQLLRGAALIVLNQAPAAEAALHGARQAAEGYFSPSSQWRAHAALARFYAAQGDARQAAHHRAAAQTLIHEVARRTPDQWREPFLEAALRI